MCVKYNYIKSMKWKRITIYEMTVKYKNIKCPKCTTI